MALKDLLDLVAHHHKTVAVALFACLVVWAVGAGFYLKVSEARIALLDERMKMQEDASKKQKHINRLVQEQVARCAKGLKACLQPWLKFEQHLLNRKRDNKCQRVYVPTVEFRRNLTHLGQ